MRISDLQLESKFSLAEHVALIGTLYRSFELQEMAGECTHRYLV